MATALLDPYLVQSQLIQNKIRRRRVSLTDAHSDRLQKGKVLPVSKPEEHNRLIGGHS